MYSNVIIASDFFLHILILSSSVLCNENKDDADNYDTDRIVGGKFGKISLAPYQIKFGGCGGAILTPTWVITAGHCYHASDRIEAGSSSVSGAQEIKVVESIRHPKFAFKDIIQDNKTALDAYGEPMEYEDYDMMLMRLEHKLVFNNNVRSIPIGDHDQLKPGAIGLISGWGQTSVTSSTTRRLKLAEIPVYDFEKCRKYHKQFGVPVDESMFCALSNNGTDACMGDSGGPFVIDKKLVGVTSFGRGCANKGSPSIWASVPFAKKWINSIIYRDVHRKRFRGLSG